MTGPDPLTLARTALAAASQCDDPLIASHYAGCARLALVRARAELKEIAAVLRAREEELARRAVPKQLPLEGETP